MKLTVGQFWVFEWAGRRNYVCITDIYPWPFNDKRVEFDYIDTTGSGDVVYSQYKNNFTRQVHGSLLLRLYCGRPKKKNRRNTRE